MAAGSYQCPLKPTKAAARFDRRYERFLAAWSGAREWIWYTATSAFREDRKRGQHRSYSSDDVLVLLHPHTREVRRSGEVDE
jgi:hypothetical protein